MGKGWSPGPCKAALTRLASRPPAGPPAHSGASAAALLALASALGRRAAVEPEGRPRRGRARRRVPSQLRATTSPVVVQSDKRGAHFGASRRGRSAAGGCAGLRLLQYCSAAVLLGLLGGAVPDVQMPACDGPQLQPPTQKLIKHTIVTRTGAPSQGFASRAELEGFADGVDWQLMARWGFAHPGSVGTAHMKTRAFSKSRDEDRPDQAATGDRDPAQAAIGGGAVKRERKRRGRRGTRAHGPTPEGRRANGMGSGSGDADCGSGFRKTRLQLASCCNSPREVPERVS